MRVWAVVKVAESDCGTLLITRLWLLEPLIPAKADWSEGFTTLPGSPGGHGQDHLGAGSQPAASCMVGARPQGQLCRKRLHRPLLQKWAGRGGSSWLTGLPQDAVLPSSGQAGGSIQSS